MVDVDVDAGAVAWAAVGALLVVGSLLAWPADRSALDWQPALAAREPWRAFSAAFVHLSALHLGANLAGAALTVAFGIAAAVPPRAALAWALAWPLTHLGLLAQPALAHYGGLSGVLHAGVAVAALQLVMAGPPRQRLVGGATLAVLAVKIASEAPWATTLAYPSGWDIAVAPGAHLSGVCSGIAAVALMQGLARAGVTRPSTSI